MQLGEEERFALGDDAPPWLAMAMRIVVEAARMLGAGSLTPVTSVHVDGCLYHGDAGVHFVERLAALGGRVTVPTSLNVGALDLIHPDVVRADARYREMASRQMRAYLTLGCDATWTCAPYQVGRRPATGERVAWAESNAVVFANSVLGARTNRNGDFLDICCALTGRAPLYGLYLDEHRRASVCVDVSGLPPALLDEDAFYPVLGAWLGVEVGSAVAVIDGLPRSVSEDRLKALGAGAASSGAVGLFHVAGVTPEAPTVEAACGGEGAPRVQLDTAAVRAARDALSTATGDVVNCIALGSPHFSLAECRTLAALLDGRKAVLPVHLCTARDTLDALAADGVDGALEAAGVRFVVDTCVVVTPVLDAAGGVMMTNSAKFAHYGPANTGYATVFGSLADCVETAVAGRLARDESSWR
jgi:predicted aconitase